jgi:hypothetical protein
LPLRRRAASGSRSCGGRSWPRRRKLASGRLKAKFQLQRRKCVTAPGSRRRAFPPPQQGGADRSPNQTNNPKSADGRDHSGVRLIAQGIGTGRCCVCILQPVSIVGVFLTPGLVGVMQWSGSCSGGARDCRDALSTGGTDMLVDCVFFYRSLHHRLPGPLRSEIVRLWCCKPQVAARQLTFHGHLRQRIGACNVGACSRLRLRRRCHCVVHEVAQNKAFGCHVAVRIQGAALTFLGVSGCHSLTATLLAHVRTRVRLFCLIPGRQARGRGCHGVVQALFSLMPFRVQFDALGGAAR